MAKVFVITGPSGVGKGTLIAALLESRQGVELSVSATTRKPRSGEEEGRDYVFLSREEFARRVDAGAFLEHATYIGNEYGTPRDQIEVRLSRGVSVVLEIELQGARQIRESMPEAVQIFVEPPSLDDLHERLVGRDTDSVDQIDARLKTAQHELKEAESFGFDAVIVNDSLERASEELKAVVSSHVRST